MANLTDDDEVDDSGTADKAVVRSVEDRKAVTGVVVDASTPPEKECDVPGAARGNGTTIGEAEPEDEAETERAGGRAEELGEDEGLGECEEAEAKVEAGGSCVDDTDGCDDDKTEFEAMGIVVGGEVDGKTEESSGVADDENKIDVGVDDEDVDDVNDNNGVTSSSARKEMVRLWLM